MDDGGFHNGVISCEDSDTSQQRTESGNTTGHCDVNLSLVKPLNTSNFQDIQGMGINLNRQI